MSSQGSLSLEDSCSYAKIKSAVLKAYELVPEAYAPFIREGSVSLVGSDVKVTVTILRDTGAFDSFILDNVFPLSGETDTGDSRCISFLLFDISSLLPPRSSLLAYPRATSSVFEHKLTEQLLRLTESILETRQSAQEKTRGRS